MHDISDIVIENPAMMHLKDKTNQKPVEEAPKGPAKQIVTKRKDGKKRITPAFIAGISASTPKPFGAKVVIWKVYCKLISNSGKPSQQ